MKVRHPRAHPDVPGKPPAKIDTPDGLRELDEDATFGQGEDYARELADRYGVPFEVVDASVDLAGVDLDSEESDEEAESGASEDTASGSDSDEDGEDAPTAAESIDAGVCPWCEDYEGDGVAQHASAAHPDEWAAYKED